MKTKNSEGTRFTWFGAIMQRLRVGCLIFLGCWIFCGNVVAALTIEEVQRDFQARYHAATGSYLTWPPCSKGTPAPAFPKKGFYGDLNENPDLAVLLVQDLVEKFYFDDPIYTNFMNAGNQSDFQGVSALPDNFSEGAMTSDIWTNVTTANYSTYLTNLDTNLQQLRLIKIQASQTEQAAKWVSDGGYYHDVGEIEDFLVAAFSALDWNKYEIYELYSLTGETLTDAGSLDAGEISQRFDIFRCCGNVAVFSGATKGKITADLTRIQKGAARLYLKVESSSEEPGVITELGRGSPVSVSSGQYGKWPSSDLKLGGVYTSDYVPNSDQAPAAIEGAEDQEHVASWVITDQVVIVAPDFTTHEDDANCLCTCASGSCSEAGTCKTKSRSLHFTISLGNDNFGVSAGMVALDAEVPSPSLTSLSSLRFSTASNLQSVAVWYDPTHFQLKSSQMVADFFPNSSSKYTISFYTIANAGDLDDSGIYSLPGDPYTVITVENPDTTGTNFDHLRITRTSDGGPTVTDFAYDENSGQWSMDTGNGIRRETRLSVWDTNGVFRTETVTVGDTNNSIAYKEINVYQLFPWGQERITNIVDPDGAALTSVWQFYTNADIDGGNYRNLKQEIDSVGHWTRYQYDSVGRETNRVTQFLSSAPDSADDANRATITIYSVNAPQITTIQKLLGSEISRNYEVLAPGEVKTIQCQTPGAAWDAPDNIVSDTKNFTSGSFAGWPFRTENPDGTVQIYNYITNATQKTTISLSGQPDPSGVTHILNGTKTVTVTSLAGKTLTNSVWYVAAGSPDILTDRDVYTYLDDRNRSYYVVHLDGTTNQYNYACCGLDSQIDRDGTLTSYTYDSLKRVLTTTVNGIVSSNIYNSDGIILGTVRYGTDGSAITNSTSTYDFAQRLISSADGMFNVTQYTNYIDGSGQTIKMTTYPGGTTRIETYAPDGSLLRVSGTAVHGVRYEYGMETDGGVSRYFTKEIKLNGDLSDTSEWSKTYQDMLGRTYKTVQSGGAISVSFYDNAGRQSKTVDPDGVTTLYQYNAKGEQEYTAVDMNTNGVIDFGGTDRISRTVSDVVPNHGTNVRRTRTYVWSKTGVDAPLLTSTSETSVDGLRSWNTAFGLTQQSQTVYAGNGMRYTTNTAPDGTLSVSASQFGRQVSSTTQHPQIGILSSTTYGYDAHGRMTANTDLRTGATTITYDNDDRQVTITTPVPSAAQNAQTTTMFYDDSGRAIGQLLPDGGTTTNLYYDTGELQRTSGTRTYPVEYTYDYAGRMKTMTTWQHFSDSTGAATTAWNYDPGSGFLASKMYTNGYGPTYTYSAGGRLLTRTWARGIVTTNAYDNLGELTGVSYSDATTPLAWAYDRMGRKTQCTGSGTHSFVWNDIGQLLSETYIATNLEYNSSLQYGYDALQRPRTLKNLSLGTVTSYGYDAASRLQTVSDGTNTAAYGYIPNSSLVGNIVFQQNGTTRLTTVKQYDNLNRLTQIQNLTNGVPACESIYSYNDANQRAIVTNADNSRWVYEYDNLGQVISGKKYWSDGTPVAGQQFEYAFDDIGNRKQTKAGGNETGANLREGDYSVNLLNQYTTRTVPGFLEVQGAAAPGATVTVNDAATYRKDDYYRAELSVNNSSSAVYESITNKGEFSPDMVKITWDAYIAQTPEAYTYDFDGNLLSDGRFTYTWDGENRLIGIESPAGAPTESNRKLEMSYDEQGRRLMKRVWTWNSGTGAYQLATKKLFWYGGWNLIGELDSAKGQIQTFYWGLDLSGSMQGAGGVMGLLWINAGTNGAHFLTYDGNGNVNELLSAAEGIITADYEYSPFGEVIRETGRVAKANPFRFSTKYQDDESDLLYYGYRYYSAGTGKWLSRDPSDPETGEDALNLYRFVNNDVVNNLDPFGLATVDFEIVKGTFSVGNWQRFGAANSGAWSQPAMAGDGVAEKGENWAHAHVSLSNAQWHTVINVPVIWGIDVPIPIMPRYNVCNSVVWNNPWAHFDSKSPYPNAGSIFVIVGSECDGRFRLTGTYQLRIGGEGPAQAKTTQKKRGGVYGFVSLWGGFPGQGPKLLTSNWQGTATTSRPAVALRRPLSIEFDLKKGENKIVLAHEVILNLPDPENGPTTVVDADGLFSDIAVEQIK